MFNVMNDHLFEIDVDTTGSSPSFKELAGGISSAEPSFNDETQQDKYLDGDGFAETDVTGVQVTISFGGHRKTGDEAQDFIFSRALKVGLGRRTSFRWTKPNGDILTGNCTIANIEGPGGDAGAKGEIAFEIHFNGEPSETLFTPIPVTGVTLAPKTTTGQSGVSGQKQFAPTIIPFNATNQGVTYAIDSVIGLAIDSNGLLTWTDSVVGDSYIVTVTTNDGAETDTATIVLSA